MPHEEQDSREDSRSKRSRVSRRQFLDGAAIWCLRPCLRGRLADHHRGPKQPRWLARPSSPAAGVRPTHVTRGSRASPTT